MPAPIDLTDRRFGGLVVLGQAGRVQFGREMSAWKVRCDCGRVEIYPLVRLPYRDSIYRTRHVVTACSVCRQPPCVVCGKPVPVGSRKNTCSERCRTEKRRRIWREHYQRRADADPNFQKKRYAARRERAAQDPAIAQQQKEVWRGARKRRRERELRDPALAEKRRANNRRWYAANAARIQAKRREWVINLSPEALDRWMQRQRAYGRAYRRRWRQDLYSHPERHRAYLERLAEYRRQRALRAMLTDAAKIAEEATNE